MYGGTRISRDKASRKPDECTNLLASGHQDRPLDTKSLRKDDEDAIINIDIDSDYCSQGKSNNRRQNELLVSDAKKKLLTKNGMPKVKVFSHCHIEENSDGIESTCGNGNGKKHLSMIETRNRLIFVSIVCLLFMIIEVVGGVLSNSLAIASDAAHLLTDLASFMISLFAIWLSSRPATKRLNFGWYRAEVIGALISVLMIWVVTVYLVIIAIYRLRTGNFEVDANLMLITAALGLGVNLVMGLVLSCGDGHGHSHFGHSHGHGHGDGHGHHHHDGDEDHHHSSGDELEDDHHNNISSPKTETDRLLDCQEYRKKSSSSSLVKQNVGSNKSLSKHSKKCRQRAESTKKKSKKDKSKTNLNIRAAIIHIIGDFLQSLGVLMAALVIYFNPQYAFVDPICTFLFSFLVLMTTIKILKEAINVLMEGMPDGINFFDVQRQLKCLPGVVTVHNMRIWSLSLDKIAISAHIVIDEEITRADDSLKSAIKLLKTKYNFLEVTIQIEKYSDYMRECNQCQEDDETQTKLNKYTLTCDADCQDLSVDNIIFDNHEDNNSKRDNEENKYDEYESSHILKVEVEPPRKKQEK